jgi:hypothetical protein
MIRMSREEGAGIDDEGPLDEASLPEQVRAMTRDTCVDFVKAMTTLPNITRHDYRVKDLFANYSRTRGNGTLIVEEELLAFYVDQSKTKDDAVAQNLKHQGVGLDLKPKIDHQALTWATDDRVVRDESTLPRARLSSDLGTLDQLLDLVETADGDEAEPIWALLLTL